MHSILEEFFYGTLAPSGQFLVKDPAYVELVQLLIRNEEKLAQCLNEKEQVMLEKLTTAQMEINQLTSVKSQAYGYAMGARMMAEAFLVGSDGI